MRFAAVILLMPLVVGLLSLPAWGLDFEPGKYEITSRIEMAGMQLPEQTTTQCLTRKEPVPRQGEGDHGCVTKEQKISGNIVTWKVECDHNGAKTQSTGRMTYHGDRFEGTFETVMGPQTGHAKATIVIKGRRIGNCP